MQRKAEWVLSFFLLSSITFSNSLISSFCRRNGTFRSKTIWVYSISRKRKWKQKITACFTLSFVAGRIILRECRPCTAKQGKGNRHPGFSTWPDPWFSDVDFRVQIAHCPNASWALGWICQIHFSLLRQSWNLNLKLKVKNKVSKSIKPHYHSSGAFILFPAFWIIENCWQKNRPSPSLETSGKLYKTSC